MWSHEVWLPVCFPRILQDGSLRQSGPALPVAALIPKGTSYSAESMQKHAVCHAHSLCVHLSFV